MAKLSLVLGGEGDTASSSCCLAVTTGVRRPSAQDVRLGDRGCRVVARERCLGRGGEEPMRKQQGHEGLLNDGNEALQRVKE